MNKIDRRDFMKLAGFGGVVFASGLGFRGFGAAGERDTISKGDFFFVQLSDTHWGFEGPANPEAKTTLTKAVEAVNSLEVQPDFVVFTGDLTHTTDDSALRRDRMKSFRDIVGKLKVRAVHFMAGEHDAALDRGDAFQELFGKLNYSFDHKGLHFVVIDNVSDPSAQVGEAQLAWLRSDLGRLKRDDPIVVLTHRPLFDLYPQWDWSTRDGSAVIDALEPHPNVVVFYGHIHQEHHFKTGHISHHAAKSLMFPLPAPGSQPKRAPLPWDPAAPFRGLGFRTIQADVGNRSYKIAELPVSRTGREERGEK